MMKTKGVSSNEAIYNHTRNLMRNAELDRRPDTGTAKIIPFPSTPYSIKRRIDALENTENKIITQDINSVTPQELGQIISEAINLLELTGSSRYVAIPTLYNISVNFNVEDKDMQRIIEVGNIKGVLTYDTEIDRIFIDLLKTVHCSERYSTDTISKAEEMIKCL